jgi:nicotinic acid mononucleotide adenylyltransferase
MSLEKIILTKNVQIFKPKKSFNSKVKLEILKLACENKTKLRYIVNEDNVHRNINSLEYTVSARVYVTNKEVYFLKGSDYYDVVHAYIVIFEIGGYVAVMKKSCSNISKSLDEHLILINQDSLKDTISDEMEFQKISLRNMTVSESEIRNKAFEAKNLNGLLSLHGLSRSIPSSLKLNNHQLKAGGLELRTESPDTGPRPVELSPLF